MEKEHLITAVVTGSPIASYPVASGDRLIQLNGKPVEDIFDYQFLVEDTSVDVLIRKAEDGAEVSFHVEKNEDEDLGLVFENGFMDRYRSCANRCIFCFIDQNPPGMRETLYFKDDDSRLSFLQGNYVTLTNMSDHDIDRIIHYHLSPINISVHTTDPELRCKMLHNRFAGEALKKIQRLYDAEIKMNGQIVLCKGINDGEQLKKSIGDLSAYLPHMESVSVVPVGITKYRDGLYPLDPFERADAEEVLEIIHTCQADLYSKYGTHFIHASDEFYLLTGRELPAADTYDGYLQLENGVGMLRLLLDEFEEAMENARQKRFFAKKRTVSIATGMLVYPTVKKLCDRLMERFPKLTVHVYAIRNDFFGERITVSGLLTGQDIVAQLQGKELGQTLFLPGNILKADEEILLDDMRLCDLERTLQVKTDIVKSSGWDFVEKISGNLLSR
ncbi:MAG: DUF512 domain-containing protein [Lachnospiraceae bacterium]|nr:DUF512 domain-containing protein [Lachnospiraceae bacterium]